MKQKLLRNPHPGELILYDFLEPLGMSTRQFAQKTGIPHATVMGIAEGRQPITLEIALKLSEFIGTSAEMWLNMQRRYDMEELRRHRMRLRQKLSIRKTKISVKKKKALNC